MTTAPDPNSADLVGMWMLNELTGTVAYDVGENQIDGTLIGDPVRTFILSEISDTLQASENSTTLTGLANYSEYAYSIAAADTAENISEPSDYVVSIPYQSSNNQSILLEDNVGYVSAGNGLDFSGSFSLSAWVKVENFVSTVISNIESETGDGYALIFERAGQFYEGEEDGFYFQVNEESGGGVTTFAPAPADEWVHVAAVFHSNESESSLSLYVNGSLSNTVTTNITQHGSINTSFVLGNISVSGNTGLTGNLDEVSVWNSALNEEQIADIMFRTIDLDGIENLAGYWRFEDSSESIAIDLSGKGNHGTLYRTSWSDDVIQFVPRATLFTEDLITNKLSVPIQVSFSVEITGFELDDIVVNNGEAVNLSGSEKDFYFEINPENNGVVTVVIPSNVVQNENGDFNLSSDTLSFLFDDTRPEVLISSSIASPTKQTPIPFNITFSEPVLGFDESDLNLSAGIISYFSGGELYSLSFEGENEYLEVPYSASMDIVGDNPFTFSAYVNLSSETERVNLFRTGIDGDPENSIYFYLNSDELYVTWEYGGGTNYNFTPADDTPINQWVYLTIVWDGSTMSIFKNENMIAQDTPPSGPGDTANRSYLIGGGYGKIRNVSYWSIPLALDQIQSNMNNLILGDEVGLVGYWNFEEGSGSTSGDLSGNSNDATIVGSTWVDESAQLESNQFALNVSMFEDGIIDLSILDGAVTDHAGNNNLASSPYRIVYNGIAPEIPQGLVAIAQDEQATLTWSENIEQDLQEYLVYGEVEGHSLKLDGIDDNIIVADSDILDIGENDFSIHFNIKSNGGSGFVLEKKPQVEQDGNEYPGYFFVELSQSGTIVVEITDGYSGAGDYSLFQGNTILNNDEWHSVAITFDRDGLGSIYVNGNLDNTGDISNHSGSPENDEPLRIGHGRGNANPFDGYLDNISFWSQVLDANDIQSLSNSFPDVSQSDLIGYWNFDEGEGLVLNDLSGNENHGLISGAIWSDDQSSAYPIPMQIISSVDASLNTTLIDNLTNFNQYKFKLSARDTVGNESGLTDPVQVTPFGFTNESSLVFDGDNDFVDPQALFPDVTNTFTMSFWAKPGLEHEIDAQSTAEYQEPLDKDTQFSQFTRAMPMVQDMQVQGSLLD